MKLLAPKTYWSLHPKKIALLINGCGTGRFAAIGILDSILCLSIEEACKIHDYMYKIGKTQEDKEKADRYFLINLLTLIEENSKFWPFKILRRYRAMTYYIAVRDGGNTAFWKGKKGEVK